MRYILINRDNIIENAIEWDGVAEYQVEDGYQLMQSDIGEIGEVWT